MALLFLCLLAFLSWTCSGNWQKDIQPNLQAAIQASNNGIQWFPGNETAPDHFKILLTEGDAMLVGARNLVYNISLSSLRLNSKLEWFSRPFDVERCRGKQKSYDECQNYIQIMVKKSPNHYYICGTNAFKPWCRTYKQEGLDYRSTDPGDDGNGICPGDPNHNSTAVYTDGELYSATMADIVNRDSLIFRNQIRTLRTSEWLNEPNFVNSMAYGEKVYFFLRETSIENINCGKTVFSRVARVCKKDRGGKTILSGFWSSFFKARLNCSIPGEFPFYFNELHATSLVGKGNYMSTDDSGNRTDMVYGIFTTPTNSIAGSAVCAFRMSDIDAAFRGPFKAQASGDSNWLPVPKEKVPDHEFHKCVNDTVKSISPNTLAFIQAHPLMDKAVSPAGGAPVLVQASFNARFTTIAVDWQVFAADNHYYDVMFVGTDDGRVIKSINKGRGAQIETVIIEDIQVFKNKEPIVSLKVHRRPGLGIEKLIVVSKDNIMSIPLHRCHERKTCSGCVALQDPYCSWADNKCSNSNRGLPAIVTGVHSYCKDSETTKASTTTETTTSSATRKVIRHTCPPPPKCVCPSPPINSAASIPNGNAAAMNDTEADVNNVVTPDRDNSVAIGDEETNQIFHSEPNVGAVSGEDKKFTVSTLAISIVSAIVVSMIAGFAAGYMVSQCRKQPTNTDSIMRDRKLPPLPLRKSQNQLDEFVGQSDPNLYQSKQLNVVLNVTPKTSNKLPNSSAETKPAHKSNKVYL